MSAGESWPDKPEGDPAPGTATGAGSSGEGSGSALAAMLRKRQTSIEPPSDPATAARELWPDGEQAAE